MEYQIGNLELKNRFFLAPMAGINDIAFRLLCKEAECGLVFTGMINPLTKEKLALDDSPATQIFANSEKGVREFIKKHEKEAQLFDLNLGCPATPAKKQGFGVFLHKEKEKIEKILKEMRKATKKPITVKIRKSDYALEILKIAEKYCDAICVHPRTQAQGYSGEPDVKFALEIKKKTKLPVIYSGNVNEENAKELLKNFDFLMIGRAAMGDPNIFSRLIGEKTIFGFFDYLKLALKYNLPFAQIKTQAMNFTKGMGNAKELRVKIFKIKNIEGLKGVFEDVSPHLKLL